MPGLLADVFSYGDSLKRKIGGLLADPMGTIGLGITRMGEDYDQQLANLRNVMPAGRTVAPQDRQRSLKELADYGSQMGLAGSTVVRDAYVGGHTAPMKGDSSAPLHDLTKIYPDDIYSNKASQYYGHYGDARDVPAVSMMQSVRNKPDAPVTMYRAVPYEKTISEQIAKIEKDLSAYQRRGNVPTGSVGSDYLSGSAWYENASNMRDALSKKLTNQEAPQRLTINNGDWVTLSKAYAKEHGEGALNGNYKIISQKVPSRKLFTDGNSIHEFGYDESGKISPALLGILGGGSLLGLGAYNYGKE